MDTMMDTVIPQEIMYTMMDTVTPQEIMCAYLCVIGTVALVLWSSRVSGRDDCGPPRAGQSEPKKKDVGGPRRAECVQRSARDMRAPEARAAHGMREPAFSSSSPALTGTDELGRAPSSARRGAYVREPAFSRSAPALTGTGELGRAPSSARRGAYVRDASLVQSAPYVLETSGRTHSSDRMRANAREAPATPGVTALPPACARWLFENECGVSALEERCAETRERKIDDRER